MKIRYEGPQDEITIRHVTFEKGDAWQPGDGQADALLAEKVLRIEGFVEVKRGRKPANGKDKA